MLYDVWGLFPMWHKEYSLDGKFEIVDNGCDLTWTCVENDLFLTGQAIPRSGTLLLMPITELLKADDERVAAFHERLKNLPKWDRTKRYLPLI